MQALEIAEQEHSKREEEAAAEAARRMRIMSDKAASLPPEPHPDDPRPKCTCLFRLPDGTRPTRRFLLEDRLQSMFDFVDSVGGGGSLPGTYQLVMQFPRRVLVLEDETAGMALGQLGLESGQQQALMLDPLVPTESL